MKKTILATMIISIFFTFTCTASATTSGSSVAQKPECSADRYVKPLRMMGLRHSRVGSRISF